ncbi:hypothetical protein cypCar_00042271 [Cyprinus carpio]|nr:hypothetical protein cypCar_00042271 [Cyprinus carpio]
MDTAVHHLASAMAEVPLDSLGAGGWVE